jgi:hypothetical protein
MDPHQPIKRHRRKPGSRRKPLLDVGLILAWADAHHKRWGRWSKSNSGSIEGTIETWSAVDAALSLGRRSLQGGSSLAKLLAEQRGCRHWYFPPRLTLTQILQWADAHRDRTGAWPTRQSGQLLEAPGETWNGIELALERGTRGLRGGTTLPQLLARRRGRRNRRSLPDLSVKKILAWAEAHHARFGAWPKCRTGLIGTTGETWLAIEHALRRGARGLPGHSTLAQLLKEQAGVPACSGVQGR